jgi:hypothetical protein
VAWREDKELLGRFLPRRGYRTQPRVGPRVPECGSLEAGIKRDAFTYILSHVSKGDSRIGCILRFLEVISAQSPKLVQGLTLQPK